MTVLSAQWATFQLASMQFEGADVHAALVARILGVAHPADVPWTVAAEWSEGSVDVQELRWNVGFGPDTAARLYRPAVASGPLPGILGLHSHGGDYVHGADELYSHAHTLASRGAAVLVHDALTWASRSDPEFALDDRNRLSQEAEENFAKTGSFIGSSLAGAVAHDDLVALSVLKRQTGVDADRVGAFGASGGGGRTLVIGALSPEVSALVPVVMMSTPEAMVPDHVDKHTWMVNPPGLAAIGGLPGLIAADRAQHHLVIYRRHDELFPLAGMVEADRILAATKRSAGSYRGSFHDGGHAFDPEMQEEAFAFLLHHLEV